MQDFVVNHYLLIKTIHIIAVISWLAGLLYLPRLFVYHASQAVGSETSELFKTMEMRLYRFICLPAMIVTLFAGLLLASQPGIMQQGWIHAKLLLVLGLFAFHGICGKWRKDFLFDRNQKSPKFFRIANEVPTLLMVIIVALAVMKPF